MAYDAGDAGAFGAVVRSQSGATSTASASGAVSEGCAWALRTLPGGGPCRFLIPRTP
jgi:hypothetical protein